MHTFTNTNGYSLVEVLVAMSILMISIVGPITIAAKSMQSAQYARQQNTAFFLAQEGISIVNTMRNNAALESIYDSDVDPWAWTANSNLDPCYEPTGCNIDFSDASLMNNIVDCGTGNCTLRYDKTAPRAVYQLVQGEETPYTRIITLTANGDELLVESRVTWDARLLRSAQDVVLETSLFNLYK